MWNCKKVQGFLYGLSFLLLFIPSLARAAAMNDYCITPPFVVGGVKPNLLLMIDNSASMYDLEYFAGSTSPPQTYSCTGGGVSQTKTSFCYDNTYTDTYTYVGYFEYSSKTWYRYDLSPSANNTTPGSNDKFKEELPPPTGLCDFGSPTGHVCINKSGSGTVADPYRITDFYATGNFLNWLSASKFDVQKHILTGGKYDSGLLLGEGRGCVGRRFVKKDPAVSGITFAVRGPNALEPDYVNPSTQGGLSRIEIFIGDITNMADCQCAIANWESGNYGQASVYTSACLNMAHTEINAFNQIMQDCWTIKKNLEDTCPPKGAACQPWGSSGNNPSYNSTKVQCENAYRDICGWESAGNCNKKNLPPSPDTIPGSITDALSNSGIWQCTNVASHVAPTAPFNYYDNPDDPIPNQGYIGQCAQAFGFSGNSLIVTWDDNCVQREILHYCFGQRVSEVIDPSSQTANTTATGNIPAVIIDSSVRQLGTPAGTFYVRANKSPEPTGLIQDFAVTSKLIRFGAMTFNCIGSGSESVPGACTTGANLDAGRIVSPLKGQCSVTTTTACVLDSNCPPNEECFVPVGDHSAGLIKNIDDIPAIAWTPFAEAFYNATAYFVKDATATNTVLDSTKFTPKTDAIQLPLPSTDSYTNVNPIQYRCQKNNVLLITDGASTADLNSTMTGKVATGSTFRDPNTTGETSSCGSFYGSPYLHDLSYYAFHRNIFDPSIACNDSATGRPILCGTIPCCSNAQTVTTHVVYTGPSTTSTDVCDPYYQMSLTAKNGGTTLQQASDPAALKEVLRKTFQTIASGASSGTAASVLASGEGSGANLVQALFYPSRTFGTKEVKWIGSLQNFWYYLDPRLGNSTIREESNNASPPYELDLKADNIIHFRFDGTNTLADLYTDPLGNGVAGPFQSTKCLDEALAGTVCSASPLGYLWEAGKKLYHRTAARTIYTTKTGAYNSQFQLTAPVSDATLQSLLQAAGDVNEASAIVNYVSGKDVSVCSITHKDCTPPATCNTGDGTCTAYRKRTVNFDGDTQTWKLGDIINSTPKVASSIPLNLYHKTYFDRTYETFVNSSDYKSRGMVFVGANDGMLHAFNLGTLTLVNDSTSIKARLDGTTASLGKEAWAFIPKNALPYLKYLPCTSTNSCGADYSHLYYVDATPYIFDASIGGYANSLKPSDGSTWRTILIGGMRFGGASKENACTSDINGDGVTDSKDCVLTPSSGLGFSSYFALDITDNLADPINQQPVLLWEKSAADLPGLGFTTSGPAVVRINGKTGGNPDPKTNGNWFVVLASGPTGPIDTTAHQFKGYSDEPLKIYVLDLKTGQLLRTIDKDAVGNTIANAFAGSLTNAAIDFDQNVKTNNSYSDDALYFGYTQAENTSTPLPAGTNWTKGGVLRLVTHQDTDPGTWVLSKVIDDTVDPTIGPVTAAVTKLQNYNTDKVFLYFGTGRYFYKIADKIDDDGSSGVRRKLYGVMEPCYTSIGFDPACTTKAGSLGDVTTSSANKGLGGWLMTMDLCTNSSGTEVPCADPTVSFTAERMVTDPLATNIGVVFFTTTKPTADVCEFGGRTHFWAVQYDTGGSVKKGILRGKALIQVSTGSIEERDLSKAFTPSEGGGKEDAGDTTGATVGGRRTDMIPGVPPSGSPPGVLIPPKPMNRIVHIKER